MSQAASCSHRWPPSPDTLMPCTHQRHALQHYVGWIHLRGLAMALNNQLLGVPVDYHVASRRTMLQRLPCDMPVLALQMMGQSGGLLPEQLASYNSINSYNSQDSIGSGRGAAMSKAFQKAQQQVQSGMLSEAQVGHLC